MNFRAFLWEAWKIVCRLCRRIFRWISGRFSKPPPNQSTDSLLDRTQKLVNRRAREAGILPSTPLETEEENLAEKQEFLKQARRAKIAELSIDQTGKFNFAVIGRCGVGKSSLVNALCGLHYTDLVETNTICPYQHPHLAPLVLWDMPGAGSINYPDKSYYEDMALHAFDAILIVLGDRVFDIDIKIAKQAEEEMKKVIFVISKADSRIKDLARRNGKTMVETATAFEDSVKERFQQSFLKAGLRDVNMFIVSNGGFTTNSPYINYQQQETDASLEAMDERSLFKFILESAQPNFPDLVNVDSDSVWSTIYAGAGKSM